MLRRKPKFGVVLPNGNIFYPRSFCVRETVLYVGGVALRTTAYLGVFSAVGFGLVFMEYEYWRAATVAWMLAYAFMLSLWVWERWQRV